eukprot:TRINITY_DN55353_c0_g1_i1.p1 TRINITY_DN55353_c0_g1~~TRINITY_DN55353_c0_g1_i1.p1  ORF type:complete len:104 (-),score=1.13 TRINITY_DN55353_c0_g1_i1:17-328(-)
MPTNGKRKSAAESNVPERKRQRPTSHRKYAESVLGTLQSCGYPQTMKAKGHFFCSTCQREYANQAQHLQSVHQSTPRDWTYMEGVSSKIGHMMSSNLNFMNIV